ncbi:MAG: ANTAR domain-containing protein [Gammaproteobacteria bacterium]|nr:ANTAR domain-containing protein [Gammaproteobacteria bacterium]
MNNSIIIISDENARSNELEQILTQHGFRVLAKAGFSESPMRIITSLKPELVLIDSETISPCLLDLIGTVAEYGQRPIIMSGQQADTAAITQCTAAGVNAFIFDNLNSTQIEAIVTAAFVRFNTLKNLKQELTETRTKLDDRKHIDRAKGLLMNKRNLSEKDAYRLIQTMAMERNQRMAEVAKNVLSMSDLIG